MENAKVVSSASVAEAADVPDRSLEFRNMITAVIVLACTSSYKLCLWLFCICYAIPKTNSDILAALANDKRNDVIATSFVITSLLVTYYFQDHLGDFAEKLDPISSAFLSCFIIYSWLQLLWAQVILLSRCTVEDDILKELSEIVLDATNDIGYKAENLKASYSGRTYAVEVDLLVDDQSASFARVQAASDHLRTKLEAAQNVERVFVRTVNVHNVRTPQFGAV
jgi:divalent metal cation (Fe/Co/Zn/Cd) transporter